MGTTEDKSPATVFQARSKKQKWAEERGAVGIIELFQLPTNFWGIATNYFSRPRIELKPSEAKGASNFIYGWIQEGETELSKTIKTGKKNKVNLVTNSSITKSVASNNVIGVIEGSDPVLKNEYVLLSAHYDHVGTGKNGGGAFTPQDSIFNGTRDNAFGTVALLSAAKALAKQTPKRSIIILAVTGEELGLLGSNFYANHPIFPLEQTIYNLNTDGAGYNATNIITLIGLGRTGADAEIEKAAKLFGLAVNADPAPEQGLFDRSDNVSFAAKGVPAPTFSPGFTAFDENIMKYYHQVTDNPESIDFDYLLKFCQSFSHAARLIADKAERPFWTSGDKYEAVGKQLYGKK
ncbi:MAG: M28 family peptidase [Saprospiraceae bacterium]|nr:M28 family peptidase [Saprospiraceae bacterium]